MLVGDAMSENTAIELLLTEGQWMVFAALNRVFGVGVKLFDSDIPRIDLSSNPRCQSDAGCLEQREVMRFSIGEGCADNLS